MKTRLVLVDAKDDFDFLGVHFRKQPSRRDASRWFCYCWPSQKSMQRIRDKVKAAIARDNRPSLQEKLDRLNPILRGWSAYFGWLNSAQHFRKVDQYVTWKLRRWLPGQASAQATGVLEDATGLLEKGRPVLDSGPDCAYELNAAGGRLPESRMRENFTYGSMRGCWRRSYGTD